MKRVKAMVLALAALSVAPAISASDASQPYNRVTAMYSNRSYGDLSTNGFEIGYVHGFSLTDKLPCFSRQVSRWIWASRATAVPIYGTLIL